MRKPTKRVKTFAEQEKPVIPSVPEEAPKAIEEKPKPAVWVYCTFPSGQHFKIPAEIVAMDIANKTGAKFDKVICQPDVMIDWLRGNNIQWRDLSEKAIQFTLNVLTDRDSQFRYCNFSCEDLDGRKN